MIGKLHVLKSYLVSFTKINVLLLVKSYVRVEIISFCILFIRMNVFFVLLSLEDKIMVYRIHV